MTIVILLALSAFVLNIPFGLMREKAAKYSFKWFLYIHLPIPFVVATRLFLGIGMKYIPILLIASICGQTYKKLTERLFEFFSSVKLAAVLIATICLTSIFGTIIEQNADPQKNIKLIGRIFGYASAPEAYKILDMLGFMDMYHSVWFLGLLFLFCLNLTICSIHRLPAISKLVNEPIKPLIHDQLNKFGIHKEFTLKGNIESNRSRLDGIARSLRIETREDQTEGAVQLYGQKGAFTRYGIYITHLSILVILTGSVIGLFFGFNGVLNLPEGATFYQAYDRTTARPHNLGFGIRCDDFDVEYYGNSDTPKRFTSWLTIIENGKEVIRKTIEVNSPLKYKGFTFYQASYGPVPENNGIIILNVTPPGKVKKTLTLREGDSFPVPGTNMVGTVAQFTPALAYDKEWNPYTYSEMMSNPAVLIIFRQNDEIKYSGWVVKRYPKTWDVPDGTRIELVDKWGAQYTGMQVRKDPGVLLVYTGFIMMILGLYFAMFSSHKKVWIYAIQDKGGLKVTIAATASKNRSGLERAIEKSIDKNRGKDL